MRFAEHYDVVVMGGGLAGLCLAVQLRRARPETSILVVERNVHPLPAAAHKVGESTVEAGSEYLSTALGLKDLLADEVPKFGLRFFLSAGDNRDVAARLEVGPSHFLTVPSYQIDRGCFENALAQRALDLGVDFVDACEVNEIALGKDRDLHCISVSRGQEEAKVTCRWVVDASGRAALLKKKLGLESDNRHDVNAAWFRFDARIDLDEWSDDPEWRTRLDEPRRLSTNHLMGKGYWVWIIPLANDRTSIGIVADAGLHPFGEIRTFEKALGWLEVHEPQCAAVVREVLDRRLDFLALKNYSHGARQMFSKDRWCLTGDAGLFLDPFYSPGNDFIGMANCYVTDLITRDLAGEEISALAEVHDQAFRSLARIYLVTYHRQYALMGHAPVMCTKIIWDFAMYWGSVALVFIRGKLLDRAFTEQVRPILQSFAYLNIGMQAFFRRWADACDDIEVRRGAFVDYADLDFLAELNRNLLEELDDESLLQQLAQNLQLAKELRAEIIAQALRADERLAVDAKPPSTTHLSALFSALSVDSKR